MHTGELSEYDKKLRCARCNEYIQFPDKKYYNVNVCGSCADDLRDEDNALMYGLLDAEAEGAEWYGLI